MRDPGLSEAIQAVGGVSELARRIGISQPSVSNWDKVPAERVLAVEAATGIARVRLRPDLYQESSAAEIDDIDLARSREYALLSALLSRAPDAGLLTGIARLGGDPGPLGIAHVALAEAAAQADVTTVEREYFNLFIGLGRGELMPYGSYYLTGFLNERPLARLRNDLAAIGVERVEGNYEPEDHAATLCEIMSGLAGGTLPGPQGAERRLFEKHMAPWIGRFFADLERADAANFYHHVGTVGRVFVEIETQAFALPS